MKKNKIRLFLLLIFSIQLSTISAQSAMDEDYTASYINERLSEDCQLQLNRKDFEIHYYEDGELVRTDYIFPEAIDPDQITYSESEDALLLVCFVAAGKCIEREIFKLDRKAAYTRSNLISDCASKDCSGLQTAVIHLINLYTLDDYERTKPFEEN